MLRSNSLTDACAGAGPHRRSGTTCQNSRRTFEKYVESKQRDVKNVPCAPPHAGDGNVQILMPGKPYEYFQTEFLKWMNPGWDGKLKDTSQTRGNA